MAPSADVEAPQQNGWRFSQIMTSSTAADEAARGGTRWAWASAGIVLVSGVSYIATSTSLIAYNKYLITHGRFPYSVPLVFIHAVFSSCCAFLLYICRPSMFPSLTDPARKIKVDREIILGGALPIAVLFSGQLALSNTAYLHSSVAFIQMMKEANLALVYPLSLMAALERFSWRNAWILVCIIMATSLTIHGELAFSWMGFSLQGISQIFESSKIVIQALLLSNAGRKLDAMTYVLLVMPLCAIVLGTILLSLIYVWPNEHLMVPTMAEVIAWSPHLFANACIAFTLNVVIAVFVKSSSAVAFILAGIVKDAMIVLSGVFILREVISSMQAVGFILQLMLILVWSLAKTFPDKFEDGVIPGLMAVLFNISPAKPASAPLKAGGKDYGAFEEGKAASCASSVTSSTSASSTKASSPGAR